MPCRAALMITAALWCGCMFQEASSDGGYTCSAAWPQCPAGQTCRDNLCVASAGTDGGDLSPPAVDAARDGRPVAEDAQPPRDVRTDSGALETCGDGERNGDEDCEDNDLGGATCAQRGFFTGTLACVGCRFDESGCSNCGNGSLDPGEDCDGSALNGATCQSQGFSGGTLGCTDGCVFDDAACTSVSCGNGKIDPGEDCEGANLGGATCPSRGFAGGTLSCKANCRLDDSGCYKCGDGEVNPGEQCDGANLGDKTCLGEGFDGGYVTCAGDCKAVITTGCYKCGDGAQNGPTEVCDGADLGGNTCLNQGFNGGTLSCAGDCKSVLTSGCYKCGDNKVNGPTEVCDGGDLGGKSCQTEGFAGGSLGCASTCASVVTTNCYKCGDNKINGPTEVCDGSDFGVKTCQTEGYSGGFLTCSPDCKTLGLTSCYKCGDGVVNPGEQCDGTNLAGKACTDVGFEGGVLACSSCAFVTSGCYKCGDGSINGPGEECDGSDYGGTTCNSLGFTGPFGMLKCIDCKISKRRCLTGGFHGIGGGTFTMGSPVGEPCRFAGREDQHQVTLTHDFEIATAEVTQYLFGYYMGYSTSNDTSCGTNCPVDHATWDEAKAYCNALSDAFGFEKCYSCTGSQSSIVCDPAAAYVGINIYACPGYRLPTDAEWEFAYRAGTTTAYYSGANISNCNGVDPNLESISWYSQNSDYKIHQVKQKTPNAWGLYDMSGNVAEWVHDQWAPYSGQPVVDPVNNAAPDASLMARGGSYSYQAGLHRAGYKSSNPYSVRASLGFGLRCVRSLE